MPEVLAIGIAAEGESFVKHYEIGVIASLHSYLTALPSWYRISMGALIWMTQ